MKKARLALNQAIRDNNAFFCPDSGLHLSLMSPVGFSNRVTLSILRGLRGKTLIDVDGAINVDKECFRGEESCENCEDVIPPVIPPVEPDGGEGEDNSGEAETITSPEKEDQEVVEATEVKKKGKGKKGSAE